MWATFEKIDATVPFLRVIQNDSAGNASVHYKVALPTFCLCTSHFTSPSFCRRG